MFKSVKTIGLTLVGLLAMLGTKAEAHYMYANGHYYYHSVGCEITQFDSMPTTFWGWGATCAVITTKVDALCPNSFIASLQIQVVLAPMTAIYLPGQALPVEVIVDDSPLKVHPSIVSACGGSNANAVLIQNMISTITVFLCDGVGPCLPFTPLDPVTSTVTASCGLPLGYSPNNLPPDRTPYTCTITGTDPFTGVVLGITHPL